MTYCAALRLERGLVFMSDTRTNAGVDNISTFRKMFNWCTPGERTLTLMTAGNLATTQAVVSLLEERTKVPEERSPSILEAPTMFQVARIIGETLRDVIGTSAPTGQNSDSGFNATLILGGQIRGMEPRLFLIYPEGNFIEASDETSYFQSGEMKYGRPIIVRLNHKDLDFEQAVRLLLVSFDSTLRANLSVGMPLDLLILERDRLEPGFGCRIDADDPYFNSLSQRWGEALDHAFGTLPPFDISRLTQQDG